MNELQKQIMQLVIDWINQNKQPIPRQQIFVTLSNKEIKDFTVANAIDSLVRKGYIRRSHVISRTTSYVQLRGL